MDNIINFRLLSHPMNWLIVTFMVLIVGIAAHLALQNLAPETAQSKT